MADLDPVFSPPGPRTLDAWLAQHIEEPIEPELRIIDCHHHLHEHPVEAPEITLNAVVWNGARSQGTERYMAEELLADIAASGHNVVATVFAQCGQFYDTGAAPGFDSVGETRACQAIADRCAAAGVAQG